MRTRAAAVSGSVVMARVASMPSRTGIRMSIRTTSGWCWRTMATACAPSAASPSTSMSGAAPTMTTKPPRTSAWSPPPMMVAARTALATRPTMISAARREETAATEYRAMAT